VEYKTTFSRTLQVLSSIFTLKQFFDNKNKVNKLTLIVSKMESRAFKFIFANYTFLSILCDIFEDQVPKSYLPSGVEAERNINFWPPYYPPYTIYRHEPETNRHVTCGPIFLMIKELAIKLKAK
jgi:hypothetical protein